MSESELAEECRSDGDSKDVSDSEIPEFSIVNDNDELHYVSHESISFPPALVERFSAFVTKLDVSSNRLDRVDFLVHFTHLRTLVLDRNRIDDATEWPKLAQLTDLSMNYNNVRDIEVFLDHIEKTLPQLGFLSLMGNPACPFLVSTNEETETDYSRYRIYVAYRLRSLRFLDVTPISITERQEALRRGKYLKTVRKAGDSSVAQPSEEQTAADLSDQPKYTPLPSSTDEPNAVQTTALFGRTKYIYHGKQSEGNRFIMNSDL